MMRTDQLSAGGALMAAPNQVPAAPVPHHEAMGAAAHAAMRHLGATGMQHASANPMDFALVNAQNQDFAPRAYAGKPGNQG